MEVFIIILLAVIATIFITLYIVLRMSVGNTITQLESINVTQTNSKVLLLTSDKQLERLAVSINKSLDMKQKTEVKYKSMEVELRQAIANMSHDLRTPLTSIIGYVQLLEDGNLPEDEKKQYIDIIKIRSKSLQLLISSFYDLSRLEAKEYKFDNKPINLSSLVCDMLASYYNDFLNKGIEPHIDIDDKVSLVIADESAVRRVLSNLIQNILRYGEKSVSISLKQEDGYIVTIFENDASNLSEEDVSHLFERFFTADRARTEKSTGLGLAIAKRLVEQMGHSISAELDDDKLSIKIKWTI